MLIVTIILCISIGLLLLEKWLTQRSIRNLQLRIHVNGSRGKSSVTEYIAAGIFNAQSDVMAKITGIIPTTIHNGKEQIIKRTGVARVQEQINIIRFAAKKKVKTLVLECMSVSPELQRLESSVFQPDIYVITNIRDDHREVMGKSIEEQAQSICNAIPKNCTVITNQHQFLNKIRESAARINSRVVTAKDLNTELLEKLPHGVFSENVALALTVCDSAGINSKLAEEGIMKRLLNSKSPLFSIDYDNKKIRFLNAFSVNDVESTDSFVSRWKNNLGYNGNISVIFNTRADRPLRTDLLAGWIANSAPPTEHIIITGNHVNRAKHSLLKAGADIEKIHAWGGKQLRNFKANLFSTVSDGSLVIGVGNIGGDGFYILNELK